MSLKIGAIRGDPMTSECSLDKICPNRGFAVDAAIIVCRVLNLNCTFVWFESHEYGDADENGRGSGLVGAIQRGEFDTSLPFLTPTFRRSRAIAFSDSYFYDDIVLVTRAPTTDYQKTNWSVIYAYQWPVWYIFIGVFLSLIIFVMALSRTLNKFEFQNRPLPRHEASIRALGRLTFYPDLMRFDSFRFIFASWSLTTLVLASAYTGILFTLKISRVSDAPFKDLETFAQCLEKNKCRVVMPTVSISYLQEITAPGNDLTSRIDKALKKQKIEIVSDDHMPKRILGEKDLYLVWVWAKTEVYYRIEGNENCDYYTVTLPYKEINAFPLRKNSSLLPILNRLAKPFKENALGRVLQSKYLASTGKDDFCGNDRRSSSWLDENGGLHSMLIIFWFYITGASIATVAFLVEVVRACLRKNYARSHEPFLGLGKQSIGQPFVAL